MQRFTAPVPLAENRFPDYFLEHDPDHIGVGMLMAHLRHPGDTMNTANLHECAYCRAGTTEPVYCCSACETLDLHVRQIPVLSEQQNPYAYLDQPEFRRLYSHDKQDFNFLFFAEGLHCSSCVHLLEKLPEFYDRIAMARVNFGQSTVAVKLAEGGSLAQVAHVIAELGYKPSPLAAQDNLAARYQSENRSFLKRIAVAGFCAGNTMLFVIPVYSGLAGTWATVFNWLSFALFLPILLYSAQPFYKGAWNSLKYKVINVDLPIAIAMLSGFALSTANLVRGDGDIYFDSTASFMFFILSARYLLKRVQQNYLSPSRMKSFFQMEKYERISGDTSAVIPWSSVNAGDVLKLKQGQSLPSDATLLSSHATLDMSLFNGESLPKVFSSGMTLFAGTKILDDGVLVRMNLQFSESKLGQLLQQLDHGALKKSRFIALTDRLAQWLIITVFSIAVLFFIAYASIDISEAFNRSLALIVLACPCALAFGSPLTFGLALKKSQRLGILLKDATSLERMLEVKNIFFDKTGTLTEGHLSLSHSEPAIISPRLQANILALEATSYHPLAFALRQAWPHPEFMPAVQNAQEILGKGVKGQIDGKIYEIRHLSESTHEDETAIEVLCDGQSLCRLYFLDELRQDSAQAVQELNKRGMNCFLLSGDKKSRVYQAANQCGIARENAHGELFPEDKKDILIRHKNTCMIGDGANDSLSLQAADVGIAVKGSVDLSLNSADVYFTRGGLSPFFDLLKISEQTQNVLKRNLGISLTYNTIGGILALAGFIDPLMAAILMPISSVVIILSSLWGFR
ncbi:cation-transporting ATPase [Bdellovibrio bacteriovorus]|uniref:heavy metal translocating P-type ATPase n=2 Tax=Bdellovibrio bacteriovorus TaxID=959 RepID=UPI00045BFF46|nr:cation-transporting ATPase [Bdellovibrio bacteriovorus]